MKVLLVIDSHVYRTPDNKFWCKGITDYNFLKRYLNVFERMKVFVRVQEIDVINQDEYVLFSGENVEVYSLPFNRNIKGYFQSMAQYFKLIKEGIKDVDCAILRLPSIISLLTYLQYKKTKKPFSVELVADISTSNDNIINKILTKIIKKICMEANGVSYVTKEYLQRLYPCKGIKINNDKFFTENYSSICLNEDFFGKGKKYVGKQSFTIVHTSNKSNTTIKGQDILIEAVGILVSKGYDVNIEFIGDSEIKDYYFKIAEKCGIRDRISFTGLISSKNIIRDHLEKGDFYVLPTKMEGLPRSIIEAMAVGLPVISTPIAGIPELIENKYLCKQDDFKKISETIEFFINNPIIAEKESLRNIKIAYEYTDDKLQIKRDSFYKKLKLLTEKGL